MKTDLAPFSNAAVNDGSSLSNSVDSKLDLASVLLMRQQIKSSVRQQITDTLLRVAVLDGSLDSRTNLDKERP